MTFSYINSKCEARDHAEGGCGVFANSVIAKGELISLWGGRIVRKDEQSSPLWFSAEPLPSVFHSDNS